MAKVSAHLLFSRRQIYKVRNHNLNYGKKKICSKPAFLEPINDSCRRQKVGISFDWFHPKYPTSPKCVNFSAGAFHGVKHYVREAFGRFGKMNSVKYDASILLQIKRLVQYEPVTMNG